MSLERFRRSRLIIQHPDATVHDAARAMEANHVGAILVQDRGELSGIVTDRDLALRVVGRGLDPEKTCLRDIMTRDVATMSVSLSEERAAELMRIRHVRRIPLVEDDHLVGLVTFDDLVLEGSLAPDRIADAIRTQLEDAADHKPSGTTHPEKQFGEDIDPRARADERFGRMLHAVQSSTGLASRELAEAALQIVLGAIVRRITYQEAADFIAQLPSKLQGRLLDLPKGPNRKIDMAWIERALGDRLGVGYDEARRIARGAAGVISHSVSAGEIRDVMSQLPLPMRQLFPSDVAAH
ncbi:MAG TPA: DUF2267 domain-containing protein [Polyangiaceae bacterium]